MTRVAIGKWFFFMFLQWRCGDSRSVSGHVIQEPVADEET